MTDKKVSVEEMLECLKEWFDLYHHEVNCSEKYLLKTLGHNLRSYDAIRAALLKLEEWKKVIKTLHYDGPIFGCCGDEEKAVNICRDIRDFREKEET